MEELELLLCAVLWPTAAALQARGGAANRACWFAYTMFACVAAHLGGELLLGPLVGSAGLLIAGVLSVALARLQTCRAAAAPRAYTEKPGMTVR